MTPAIEAAIAEMSDKAKAQIASEIMSTVEPTGTNLDCFFENLADQIHDELINRAYSQEVRDQ